MSGLASVLAGHTSPGVYRWHAAFPVPEIEHTVEHAGWVFGHVDGWLAQTRAEFLEAVGLALDFPAHYGQNFDALVDCLREVPAEEGQRAVLLWDGWGPLASDDPATFQTALRVFRERAGVGVPGSFVVLLRGVGPESGDEVPSID